MTLPAIIYKGQKNTSRHSVEHVAVCALSFGGKTSPTGAWVRRMQAMATSAVRLERVGGALPRCLCGRPTALAMQRVRQSGREPRPRGCCRDRRPRGCCREPHPRGCCRDRRPRGCPWLLPRSPPPWLLPRTPSPWLLPRSPPPWLLPRSPPPWLLPRTPPPWLLPRSPPPWPVPQVLQATFSLGTSEPSRNLSFAVRSRSATQGHPRGPCSGRRTSGLRIQSCRPRRAAERYVMV